MKLYLLKDKLGEMMGKLSPQEINLPIALEDPMCNEKTEIKAIRIAEEKQEIYLHQEGRIDTKAGSLIFPQGFTPRTLYETLLDLVEEYAQYRVFSQVKNPEQENELTFQPVIGLKTEFFSMEKRCIWFVNKDKSNLPQEVNAWNNRYQEALWEMKRQFYQQLLDSDITVDELRQQFGEERADEMVHCLDLRPILVCAEEAEPEDTD